jgi:hypothetical protein
MKIKVTFQVEKTAFSFAWITKEFNSTKEAAEFASQMKLIGVPTITERGQ